MSEETPHRFRLKIAYDGRPFEGWQSQAGGNTVQDRLLAALRKFGPEIETVQGSGRTDAGVSAEGQVAHFDAPPRSSMDAGAWLRALNSELPATIRILKCAEVSPDFHARFSAVSKTYCYDIWTGPVLPPLKAGLAWHLPGFSEAERFQDALSHFEGRHDFRAFSANRGDGKDADRDTFRTLSEARAKAKRRSLRIQVSGDGFLYKMVRFLVGSAHSAARGKLSIEEIDQLLEGVESTGEKAPFCAPANGLRLVKVRYAL